MRTKTASAISLIDCVVATFLCVSAQVAPAQNLPTVNAGDSVRAVDINRIAQAIDSRWEAAGADVSHRTGNVGIGPAVPAEKLHVTDGHILLEGGTNGSAVLKFKRDFIVTGGPSGMSVNPLFEWGRIEAAGDGDPEIKVLYSDDGNAERSVFKLDRKGIVASVKTDVGSHFEGFLEGDEQPLFRLNSLRSSSTPADPPSMQLEMGRGSTTLTDAALRRTGPATLSFLFGDDVRSDTPTGVAGNVGIGTATPTQRLDVAGNVRAVSFIAGNTTLMVPDYVFDDGYPLMSLDDLRAYTKAERHLPNLPGATEVARDGVDLGQFQMKLLEKIEELTLHLLNQQRTLHAQQVQIEALEAQLRQLRAKKE